MLIRCSSECRVGSTICNRCISSGGGAWSGSTGTGCTIYSRCTSGGGTGSGSGHSDRYQGPPPEFN